jgi:histidinol-phosphate aminotransferase
MKPYATARDDFIGEARVFLDANENPNSAVLSGISTKTALNRYPDPYSLELRHSAANLAGISPENCLITNGSDEGIELLLKACCVPVKDAVLITPPSYGMYRVAAATHDLPLVEIPLMSDGHLDVSGVLAAVKEKPVKVCFFCSPNNPTGNLMNSDDVLSIAAAASCLVVVDEAYIEFAAPGSSLVPKVSSCDNLVVLQTFSKAWGFAGLRAGKVFAHRDLISALLKIKPPYNVNVLTQKLIADALAEPSTMMDFVQRIWEQKCLLVAELGRLSFVDYIFPSDANFLLVRFQSAEAVFRYLLACGIIVRDRSREPGCENCLRITIGTAEENRALIESLREFS